MIIVGVNPTTSWTNDIKKWTGLDMKWQLHQDHQQIGPFGVNL